MIGLILYIFAGSSAFIDFETEVESQPATVDEKLKACLEKLRLVNDRLKAVNLGELL